MSDDPWEHRPQGPGGYSVGTAEAEVTIRDRHGCEVVFTATEALHIASSIMSRYGDIGERCAFCHELYSDHAPAEWQSCQADLRRDETES